MRPNHHCFSAHCQGLKEPITIRMVMVFRLSHVLLTSFTPLAVSKFTKAACGDQDVASLSAIFIGASAYLNTLGSHTLVNSFVSPVIFLSLATAINVVQAHNKSFPNSSKNWPAKRSRNSHQNDVILLKRMDLRANPEPENESSHGINKNTVKTEDKDQQTMTLKPERSRFHPIEITQNSHIWCGHEVNHFNVHSNGTFSYGSGTCLEDKTCLLPALSFIDRVNRLLNSFSSPSQTRPFDFCHDCVENSKISSSNSCRSNSSSSTYHCSNSINETKSAEVDDKELYYPVHEVWSQSKDIKNHGNGTLPKLKRGKDSRISPLSNILSGFMLTLTMYIRPDAALFVGVLLVGNHQLSKTISLLSSLPAIFLAIGGVSGLVLAVANDAMFYGTFVLTPVNWVCLNVFSNTAVRLFGKSEWLFYISRVFLRDSGMSVATFVFTAAAICFFISYVMAFYRRLSKVFISPNICKEEGNIHSLACSHNTEIHLANESRARQFVEPFPSQLVNIKVHIASVIILTVMYSCMGHKEERFLHDIVILFLITVSETILIIVDFGVINITCVQLFSTKVTKLNSQDFNICKNNYQSCRTFFVVLLTLMFLFSQTKELRSSSNIQIEKWHLTTGSSGLDTNLCMYFLSKQRDVSGVFIDRKLIDTAGHSILHKDVPLLYLIGNNFVEFTKASLVKVRKDCVIGNYDEDITGNSNLNTRDNVYKESVDGLSRHKNSYCGTTVNCSNKQHEETTEKINRGNTINLNINNNHNTKSNNEKKSFCTVSYYSLNTVSDLIFKENSIGVMKKIAGVPHTIHKCNLERNQLHPHSPNSSTQGLVSNKQQLNLHRDDHDIPGLSHYNYAIIPAKRPFLSPSFRPVYQTATMWVWRRVNTPQTEARLFATVESIEKRLRQDIVKENDDHRIMSVSDSTRRNVQGDHKFVGNATEDGSAGVEQDKKQTEDSFSPGNNNSSSSSGDFNMMLEYEGETLKQLGNYRAALIRFEVIAMTSRCNDLNREVKVSVLASMVYCLHQLGEQKRMKLVLKECVKSNPRDRCLDGWRARKLKVKAKFEAHTHTNTPTPKNKKKISQNAL
ncbi:mannosyltransferase [Plakobranchus ocellatus]|uniref:Mannosyltransferase n=1 Tax=Plakobranchus ocellatus TaxID=259542 RepID=A0AAV4CTJ3_9GAST|nr:mannosyltransferase [Plakobranchus ocellatus]